MVTLFDLKKSFLHIPYNAIDFERVCVTFA